MLLRLPFAIYRIYHRQTDFLISEDIYKFIIGNQQTAIDNAKNITARHIRDYGRIDPLQNPITMIFELVECLNHLYTKDKTCECYPNKEQNIYNKSYRL